jgi:small-conductance mechanosensitive channel
LCKHAAAWSRYRTLSPVSSALASLLPTARSAKSMELQRDLAQVKAQGVTSAALNLMSAMIRGAMWLLAVATFLTWMGYEMTTAVSVFGVGGVAIGLATQGVLKDVVGTILLVFDEWFDVGSKITFQGVQGKVERFGMLQTKIRLVATGEVMYAPNSLLATAVIISRNDMPTRRTPIPLWLPGDTPRATLRAFRDGLAADVMKIPGAHDATVHITELDPVRGILLEVCSHMNDGLHRVVPPWATRRCIVHLSKLHAHGPLDRRTHSTCACIVVS